MLSMVSVLRKLRDDEVLAQLGHAPATKNNGPTVSKSLGSSNLLLPYQ